MFIPKTEFYIHPIEEPKKSEVRPSRRYISFAENPIVSLPTKAKEEQKNNTTIFLYDETKLDDEILAVAKEENIKSLLYEGFIPLDDGDVTTIFWDSRIHSIYIKGTCKYILEFKSFLGSTRQEEDCPILTHQSDIIENDLSDNV